MLEELRIAALQAQERAHERAEWKRSMMTDFITALLPAMWSQTGTKRSVATDMVAFVDVVAEEVLNRTEVVRHGDQDQPGEVS